MDIIKIQDTHAWNSESIYENNILKIYYLSHCSKVQEHGTGLSLTLINI